jgi:hypothetical protein
MSDVRYILYQTLYWYSWFSWWWARGCSKHVEDWNKHTRKENCAWSWSYTRIKPRRSKIVSLLFHHDQSTNLRWFESKFLLLSWPYLISWIKLYWCDLRTVWSLYTLPCYDRYSTVQCFVTKGKQNSFWRQSNTTVFCIYLTCFGHLTIIGRSLQYLQ